MMNTTMAALFRNILLILLVAATIFEGIALLQLALSPVTQIAASGIFVGLFLGIFDWLIPLSPFLLLCLLYFPLIQAVVFWAKSRSMTIKRLTEEFSFLKKIGAKNDQSLSQQRLRLLEHARVVLIISMILAILVAYFPYRLDLNPRQIPVGIDANHYIREIDGMLREPFSDAAAYALGFAWSGSRPLFLLGVYFAAQLANVSAEPVIRFLPEFLAPLLVLAAYGFVSLVTGRKEEAAMAALLTAFSPVVTVGMWAGYYANWLAIIEAFVFLGILLSYLQHPTMPKLAVSISLSVALLFTHLWTWIVVIPVTFVFLFTLRREIMSRVLLKVGGLILLADFLAESLKSLLLVGYSEVATGRLIAGQISNPFSSIDLFFPNVASGLLQTYDGLLANSVLLILAFISAITLRYQNKFERLLLFWVVMTALAFPLFNDLLQSRLVYNLPLAILASSGLLRIIQRSPFKATERNLILLIVTLFNANYALLAMTSLPLF